MAERSIGASAARGLISASRWTGRQIRGEVVRRVGGAARARVIVLFGLVLALNGADTATIGAVAPELERNFHIGAGAIGLLSSVTLIVGAVTTIPVGLLVDRIRRIPMLSLSIVLWSVASLLSAFAGSYSTLLLTRLLLGAVVATAGPAIASLTGDYFPARERGRIYAYILGGEISGNAFGFIISGNVAVAFDWRAAFVLLAIPGFFLARELYRTVPEPLRGGQSHLEPGVEDLVEAAAKARARLRRRPDDWFEEEEHKQARRPAHLDDLAQQAARRLGHEPDPERVLTQDPRTITLRDAVRYTLSIPSNVMMIVSSSLGYFFFSGLTTFALLFVRGHYHVGAVESDLVLALLVIGALAGTLASGWLGDTLLRRGMLASRVWLPAVCYLLAALLLIPGFVATRLTPALWFDVAGAALLAAANPPLDAARLDIMPAGLWGRAESIRTVVRSLAQAFAPLIFGELASLIAGFYPPQAPIGTHPAAISSSEAHGLEITFLVLLVALAAAGVVLLRGRHLYPRDVATAGASNQGSVAESISLREHTTQLRRPASGRYGERRPQRPERGDGRRRRWD
ncbi:MAG: MFS transporter [Actinomycetota bacterium]|nr:MFS transporter [Actinomycetota bacterium]